MTTKIVLSCRTLIEVASGNFDQKSIDQVNSTMDQYLGHNLPQLKRLKSATFTKNTPVDTSVFDGQIRTLYDQEVPSTTKSLSKSILMTTPKMSYKSLLEKLPMLESQLSQLFSEYGQAEVKLVIVNDPTEMEQNFTLQVRLSLIVLISFLTYRRVVVRLGTSDDFSLRFFFET